MVRGKRRKYETIVVTDGILYGGGVSAMFALFRGEGVTISASLGRSLPYGAALILLTVLIGLKLSRPFSLDFSSNDANADSYGQAFKKLGNVPIHTLIWLVSLDILYLILVTIAQKGEAATSRQLISSLFVMQIAGGMLGIGFTYIVSDRIVSRFLIEKGLQRFPLESKEDRQKKKNLIIPMFIAVMSILFSSALVVFFIQRETGDASVLSAHIVPTVAIMGAFFAIIVILVVLWSSNTSMVYAGVISNLEQMCAQRKDISKRIVICSVDEIGRISGLVNQFSDNLTSSLSSLVEDQEHLRGLSRKLVSSAEQSVHTAQNIAGNVKTAAAKAESQSNSVSDSSSAVERISGHIESLDNLITDQSASVTEASASVEEMVGNIGSITKSIDKMAEQFRDLLSSAEKGKAAQTESTSRVADIVERSNSLLEANDVIASIASQTNLLAMNAAIEAAHAGESGRGFSVVADEIRRLAETSAEQSKSIRGEIAQVQDSIENVVRVSKASEESFSIVAKLIAETETLVREIQNAMGEQLQGASEVLEALKKMNSITSQVSDGSKEMKAGNQTVLLETANLREDNAGIKSSMDEIVSSTATMGTDARRVSGLAQEAEIVVLHMDETLRHYQLKLTKDSNPI